MSIKNLAQLRTVMRNCDQTKNFSVLQHGVQVARFFKDLRNHVINGEPLKYEWKLPEWATDPQLWGLVLPFDSVYQYLVYHDCGKPFCKTVDAEGKQHFPDHASVSASVWRELSDNELVASLIEKDMQIHLLKGEQVEDFCKQKEAATLLFAGLSEVHANASMFGGIDSTSFKIKYKQINRRGNAICKLLTN